MLANKPRLRHFGFTLIETIVVILVVCLLLSLLIPAVQYARESSRRLSCANNLKQLGLALINYEASFHVYPQGINGGTYSAHVMLLPFYEQNALYNTINFSSGGSSGDFADGQSNATVAKTMLTSLTCPSDASAFNIPVTSYGWNGGFGKQMANFVGGFGCGAVENLTYLTSAGISDGLSVTSAASEWKIGYVGSSDDSTAVFKVKFRINDDYLTFIKDCLTATREKTDFSSWTKNGTWYIGSYGSTILNFNSSQNTRICTYGNSIDYGNWPISSSHTNGVNIVFFDGHVEHLSKSVSLPVLKSLSSKAGNDNL